jgi:hypothetical protein
VLSLPPLDFTELVLPLASLPRYNALDECPNNSGTPSARKNVLALVKDLVDHRRPNLHLCITSRPEEDIRTALEPLAT